MNMTQEKAWAKLNISLDVAERRDDGYHNMVMIMQTVSLHDDVTVTLVPEAGVRARSNFSFIPGDERNLAVRAAQKYLETIGRAAQGVLIDLRKNIPVGAGMGGGSSDAAAVLRALNRLLGAPLTLAELEALASSVGSDVPFCVAGGTALATGRGELLSPLPPVPDCAFVVCKPSFSISTPELFRKLDQTGTHNHPDTAGLIRAIEQRDLRSLCRRMYNVFEDVGDRRLRAVSAIKSTLLDFGALGAVMTGTGSAVFGVFPPDTDAAPICRRLRREYGFCEAALAVPRVE